MAVRCDRLQLLRYAGLVSACLAEFMNGAFYAFNVYMTSIKATFGYSQTEVEMMASMFSIGISLGIFSGAFYDHFGPTWTMVVAPILNCSGYLLLFSAHFSVEFYSRHSELLMGYYLIVGIGGSFTYIAAAVTNTKNFPTEHRAKVIGLLDIMFGGSPLLFSLAYFNIFAKGHTQDPANQNVAGFMMMYVIGHGGASLLCLLVLRVYPHDNTEVIKLNAKKYEEPREPISKLQIDKIEKTLKDSHSQDQCNSESLTDDEESLPENASSCLLQKKVNPEWALEKAAPPLNKYLSLFQSIKEYICTTLKMIMTADCQLLLWTFSCNVAVATMIYNNIAVILKFNGLIDYQTACTLIPAAVRIPVGFGYGVLSDLLQGKVPRASFFILAGVLNLICQCLCIFFLDSAEVLLTVSVLTGVALGISWFMGLTLASELFSAEYLGRIWGFCLLGQAVVVSSVQGIFGSVFDSNFVEETAECNGDECFMKTFVITTCISIIPIVTSLFLTVRSFYKKV